MNIHQRITEITVSVVPEDHPDSDLYAVRVGYRGEDRYAVQHMGKVLSRDGEWEYEPIPSSRSDAFKQRTRFSYLDAVRLAIAHAPDVTINGRTAAQALATWKREVA